MMTLYHLLTPENVAMTDAVIAVPHGLYRLFLLVLRLVLPGAGRHRRRANGESVEQIQPDLIIPTGKRKGQNPSVASIYRALAEHAKREAYPEAVEQTHADFAALHNTDVPRPRPDAVALSSSP